MMQFLSTICFIAFLILLILTPILPISMMWRSATVLGVMLVASHLLRSSIPTTKDDGSLGIGSLAAGNGILVVIRLGLGSGPIKLD